VRQQVAPGRRGAQHVQRALGARLLVERAELARREPAVVAGRAARQERPHHEARLLEQRAIAAEHEIAEQPLEVVAVALERTAQDARELVAAVVELHAVDDLDPVRRIVGRREPDELRRRHDVDALEIEIAVGRRKAVRVRARQVDHEVTALALALGEPPPRHLGLRRGEHTPGIERFAHRATVPRPALSYPPESSRGPASGQRGASSLRYEARDPRPSVVLRFGRGGRALGSRASRLAAPRAVHGRRLAAVPARALHYETWPLKP
jgi:hypothetical protein